MREQGASNGGSKLVTVIGPSLHLPVGRAHGRRSASLLSRSLLVYLPVCHVPKPKAASCEEKPWHMVCGVSRSHSRAYQVVPKAERH